MSYNQTHTKQFVKAKPLQEAKDKPPSTSFTKDTKRNSKKYQEKSFQQNKDPRDHIKMLLNEFKPQQKTPFVASLCSKFPKLFVDKPLKPQAQIQSTLTEFIIFGTKKQIPNKAVKQMSSDSSEPNWDSDEQKQVKLVSKKIDETVVDKVNAAKKQAPKKMNDLQRHEKQFLQDYYRQKRHNMEQKIEQDKRQEQRKEKERNEAKQRQSEKVAEQKTNQIKEKEQQDQWAEYDPNVGALITGGFIQKIQKGQEQDFENDEDFSYESQKSSSSSSDDDDMFADEGPRAIVKTKADSRTQAQKIQSGKQIVNITSHMFTLIAEEVGAIPQSCTWIISNKQARFKVSTQYMNEYYKSLSSSFPFISLNHSQFVPYEELQTEKGIEKLKKSGQKRRNANGFNKNRNPNRVVASHYKQKK